MSSYAGRAIHPETGETEPALFIDDHFGPHRYGVRFADGKTFTRSQAKEVGSAAELSSEEARELFRKLSTAEEFPAVHADAPDGGVKP